MFETRYCPHCNEQLDEWEAPPETGWGIILVCNNNYCKFFLESRESIQGNPGKPIGCRYAENPDNHYRSFSLASWCNDTIVEKYSKE